MHPKVLKQSRTICPGIGATHSELGPLPSINNQGHLVCLLQICASHNLIGQVSQLRHSPHEILYTLGCVKTTGLWFSGTIS